MAVRHKVSDTDKHFIIDPVTRTIKNQSGKLVLIQYDHNSERFTFECPRLVDGHDMSLCNKVEIHYINTGTGNYKSSGVYETDDLKIPTDNGDNVTFSWLVSQNATQHVGKLNFVIRFACVGEDAVIEYAWNTGIYSDIAISKSIYNGEEFVENYIDVLEAWKQDLYSAGLKISSVEQTTTSTEAGGVNVITMTMTDGSKTEFQIQNGSPGPSGISIKSIERTSGNGTAGSTDVYTITLTDGSTSTFQIYNGANGTPGNSIASIARTFGNGAPGSTDTYTITLTDGSTTTFQVYNGANGASGDGSGDMTSAMYDPQGKRTDIFAYADAAVNIAYDEAVDKQPKTVDVEILETICENVTFDDINPTYTLPSAITLDEYAVYYIDCRYYETTIEAGIHEGYSIRTFSKATSGSVKWGSVDAGKGITLNDNTITNNWRDPGNITVVSIYKVRIIQDNPLLTAAVRFIGHKAFAPGGYHANAEGYENMAYGFASHAEGKGTHAFGDYSHTEGRYSSTFGYASHAEGISTIAQAYAQHVQGTYNIIDEEGNYLHIVGNGNSDTERSNAHTIDWDGNAWFSGNISGKQTDVSDQLSVKNDSSQIVMWPSGIAGTMVPDSDESYLWIGSDGEAYFTNLFIKTYGEDKEVVTKEVATKDDIAAAITGAIEGSY